VPKKKEFADMSVTRLGAAEAQLVVVDLQGRLLPYIGDHQAVVAQCTRMIRAARELELPITVTEQYAKGLGPTAAEARAAAADAPRLEKLTFSAWRDIPTRERITALGRKQVLLVGIEAHVCVLQTALDLLEAELVPFVLADAVGSRRAFDRDVALERMRSAGIVVSTVESAIFEMLDRCDTELFKRILPIVR
jgi:nicotinamidase-related amidase